MPPSAPPPPLSQSELTYLTHSLLSTPPLRPDGRLPTQFRPLHAETSILPFCPGSARLVWADGAECVCGIKLDVTPTITTTGHPATSSTPSNQIPYRSWVEVSVDVQGGRDDDPLNVFLAGVVGEGVFAAENAALGGGGTSAGSDAEVNPELSPLLRALKISPRHHWTLYIDILLITPPPTTPSLSTTHPLTLLSLTTHLALRTTLVPLKISQGDEDPMFHDDWDLAVPLYRIPDPVEEDEQEHQDGARKSGKKTSTTTSTSTSTSSQHTPAPLPPISLLAMALENPSSPSPPTILLDPSRDELSVAHGIWAISFLPPPPANSPSSTSTTTPSPKIINIRTLESTSIPVEDQSFGGAHGEKGIVGGRGGVKRDTVRKVLDTARRAAGEVWEALEGLLEAEREREREM